MFAKYMTTALVGSALLATAAIAQSPTATQSPAATTSDRAAPAAATSESSSYNGDWRASKVVGLNVYNDANEKVGSINDLLTDKNGNIKAVVIGVGGFLGVGEHLVAVAFDKVKFVTEPVQSTTASNSPGAAGMPNRPATSPNANMTTGAATTAPAATRANPWYPDHAVFNATKDQLKEMPEFKYST
jgi:sporulation protein YlmC with PRC-barrel domain